MVVPPAKGYIANPRETESIFSRGKESSTLTSASSTEDEEDDNTPTLSATTEEEEASEDYQGHLILQHHQQHQSQSQSTTLAGVQNNELRLQYSHYPHHPSGDPILIDNNNTMRGNQRIEAYDDTSPRPPRHPGHFSFSDVGRRKRSQMDDTIRRTNPFEPSTNPFDTSTSRDESNYSNSIVEEEEAGGGNDQQEENTINNNNPFDETSSADFVEASYPPRQQYPTQQQSQPQQSFLEQRNHSWDSDRQFPILEIERIKRKTKKLKEHNSVAGNNPAADDGFSGKPVFPRPASANTRTTASVTTAKDLLSANGDNRSSTATPTKHRWSPIPYNYTTTMTTATSPSSASNNNNPPPVPNARRRNTRNRYFPANDSLAEVLDQPTVQTSDTHSTGATPRSKISERAEQELLQSFKKPGKPRNTHHRPVGASTTTTTTLRAMQPPAVITPTRKNKKLTYYDEKKDDYEPMSRALSSPAKSVPSVNLPPPADAPSSVDGTTAQHECVTTTEETSASRTTHEREGDLSVDLDLTLHDLCAEAADADDIAWRNALCLLSNQPHMATIVDPAAEQFTPLHVCCLGPQPPPSFMILALLYANPAAARTPDAGGRLPLHLVAASSADVTTIQWLVQEYPAAVSHTDEYGCTPLHLYLKRPNADLDPSLVQMLLGNVHHTSSSNLVGRPTDTVDATQNMLFRRGAHFRMPVQDMKRQLLQRPRPVTRFTRVDHEAAIAHYSPDIQVSLRKLARWQTKQQRSADYSTVAGYPSSPRIPATPTSSAWSRTEWPTEEDLEEADEADIVSPAMIPFPTNMQLPIHMVIQRVLHEQETQDLSAPEDAEVDSTPQRSRSESDEDDEADEDEQSEHQGLVHKFSHDTEQPRLYNSKSPLADPKIMEVMRLLVDAFPEGLSLRDEDGFTPLLMVLSNCEEQLPNFDVVCMLLGRRTANNDEWRVDKDIPMHGHTLSAGGDAWMNPAMVPATWTKQLPLHIIAEEFLSELPLVQVVYEAYPAAIQVQDAQGRTPLHLALSSYRNIAVDPRVMNMLFSETVAQTQDRKGHVPLDVMLDNADVLPDSVPWAWKLAEANDPAVGTVYQRFFHASLLHLASSSSSPSAGREILHELHALPQWVRRQACVSTFIQELLIEEVATPWKSALIMLDGFLLVGLLTVFRLQMNDYIVTGSYLATWYTFAVYAFAAARFLFLGTQAALASTLGQYNDAVMLNLWYWVDYAGMILAIITSVLFNGTVNEDTLLSMGTAATGFLWWSVVGYISRWSFAMAVFSGILRQLATYVFYVLLAFGIVIVAFGQMLYTVFQTSCEDAVASSSVCTVRDAYRVMYLLLRGESFADETGTAPMTPQAISMVATFFFFVLVVIVGLLAVVVLVAGQVDVDELARRSFWEPMLAYVMSMNTLGCCARSKKRTCGDWMSAKLGVAWDVLTVHYRGQDSSSHHKNKTWFARPRTTWPLAIMSVVIIPVWLLLGFVTLGFLWPPQIRRALFRPCTLWQRRRSIVRASETTSQQLNGLRSETVKFKVLSYDRMMSMEKELRELKNLLSVALKED